MFLHPQLDDASSPNSLKLSVSHVATACFQSWSVVLLLSFLRPFYPWLLSLYLGCSCNHSSHACLDICLLIPDTGSCSGFTFLHSFILVCSAFRSWICRKYSLPVSSTLLNSWSWMSLATQGLSNDPDHTYHHTAGWRESNKFKLKILVAATYVTILRYGDGVYE